MDHNNEKTIKGAAGPGHKSRLKIEVQFIKSEEGTRRWEEIFKLLEADKRERSKDSLNEADGREYDQLSLF